MARLGDVCVKKVDTIKATYKGNIDYIDISSVDNQRKEITQIQSMAFEDAPSRAKQLVYAGDILVSTVRPNLNAVALIAEDSDNTLVASTGYCVLRCLPNADRKYVFYFCQSNGFIEKLVTQATGASYPAVTSSIVKECSIPLPSLDEQRKIAAVLDKVSNLIAKRRRQLDKLDELVKSRFVELFGDQKANPFGWSQTTIGDCCTLKSGTSLPADKENEGGAIPYVKVGDMNYPGNEQYITTSSRFVTEQTAGAGIFPVGTVIFPKRGGAIGTNKKRLTTLPICADLNVMGVTAGNALKSQYLMAYFNMVDLGALDNGSSVPQINNKDIATLVICLPPLGLQEQFAAFVAQTDKAKSAIQKSLDKLETLKKALMQQYFG